MTLNVRIQKLLLQNYRNHEYLQLDLNKNIIIIHGKNGSGKTNILESISLLDSPTGLKNASLSEIVKKDFKGHLELFGVNLSLITRGNISKIGLGLKRKYGNFGKILKIDGVPSDFSNLKEFLSIFSMVPKMSYLFQAGPEDRRNFLDLMISSIDILHKKRLQTYNKYRLERIKILKKWNDGFQNNWLDVIESKMASIGIVICDARRNFVKVINSNFEKKEEDIPILEMSMNGDLDLALRNYPAVEVEDFFCENLRKNRQKDSLTGRTNFGANKTDLVVVAKKKNIAANNFSTGEQKIIVLAIVFAFLKYLKKINFTNIIFLLDDIFSYLDLKFINLVLEELNNLKIQTWVTDVRADWVETVEFKAEVDKINIDDNRFKVVNNLLY